MIEPADVRDLEAALDQMGTLHDEVAISNETARVCLCSAAATWRRGIKVTAALRERLGMKQRLLDQPVRMT